MVQIRARSETPGAHAFAMAAFAAALMALTAIAGYEIGSSRAQSNSFLGPPSAVQPAAGTTTDAPPITGLQP